MHSLAGTFLQDIPPEVCPESKRPLYAVKIVLPPNKSRILYFEEESAARSWRDALRQCMGY